MGHSHWRGLFIESAKRALVLDYMGRTGNSLDAATWDLSRDGAGNRILGNAYRLIERNLGEANARKVFYDDGDPLPEVSPRDLVPTRRLLVERI
jgi:hypothetical protein